MIGVRSRRTQTRRPGRRPARRPRRRGHSAAATQRAGLGRGRRFTVTFGVTDFEDVTLEWCSSPCGVDRGDRRAMSGGARSEAGGRSGKRTCAMMSVMKVRGEEASDE
eukprot:142737-Hanusia_phi.AAC.2